MRILACALAIPLAACSAETIDIRPLGQDYAQRDPVILRHEARAKFETERFAEAAALYRRAVRLDPTNILAVNGLAATYDRLGRFDLSQPLYQRALALAPGSRMVQQNFALSLRMQGDSDMAQRVVGRSGGLAAVIGHDSSAREKVDFALLAPDPRSSDRAGDRGPDRRPMLLRAAASGGPAENAPLVLGTGEAGPLPDSTCRTEQHLAAANAPQIRIVNASGRRGSAAAVRTLIRRAGWSSEIGDAPALQRATTLFAPESAQAAAFRLASALPFPVKVRTSGELLEIRLVLGSDHAPLARP
jgi:tetratricopeptide (TPR) repeat protein